MGWLEPVAAAASIWAVWLTTRRRPWCWPIGLVSVLLYAWVFVGARLYSDALLQLAFAVLIVYGWVRWSQHLESDGRVAIAPLDPRRAVRHVALGVLGAVALGAAMHSWTNAALPWLDAALTAFSLVAQWWQARRHVAAWWLWITVDVIYVGEYLWKDLVITAVLYVGLIALAIAGLRAWRQAARASAQHTA